MTGRTLGHYRILEQIGAGGRGEVYRAADTRLGREVEFDPIPDSVELKTGRRVPVPE
jgi:serine/threonine protein kinase